MPFGTLLLLSPTERSIVVQTHRGRSLKNAIALEPDRVTVDRYHLLRSKHPGWQNRKPACGVYNCFGHLFASRRTSIREDVDVEAALVDDGYRRLLDSERARPGDIVLYRDLGDGRLLHGGQVIGMATLAEGSRPLPRILSKWNDSCGEDEHMIADVPYPDQGIRYTEEFWTDRPTGA